MWRIARGGPPASGRDAEIPDLSARPFSASLQDAKYFPGLIPVVAATPPAFA
jgi:hypothetical protein